jgi:RND family efflux transporter MFP subunit
MKQHVYVLAALTLFSCGRKDAPAKAAAEPEPHPESVTAWTTKTELFAEYPPLVAGQTSRFAIHLTRLDNFKPVTQGRVEVQLVVNGKKEVFSTDGPSRPGIFGVDVKPTLTGEYRVSISLASSAVSDTHDLGIIESFEKKQAAFHEHGPETDEKIAFLKEQQWTLDFGTDIVLDRRLESSLRVPGEIVPRSGGEAEVKAPFDGRLIAAKLPIVGARVTEGQLIANLLPPTTAPGDFAAFELAQAEARAALELARKDLARAERLVSAGAAPAKRLDEARTVETTAAARLKAAEARLAQYSASSSAEGSPVNAKLFALRAPISGIVTQTSTAPEANVKAGETLVKIVDVDTVYVAAIVPEADLPLTKQLSGAEIEIPGTDRPRRLQRLISLGRIVDPASRTLPITYEFDNRDRAVALNQAVRVRLLTALTTVAPVVPESAIVDDGGRPIVFVQQSGETFLRRPVKLGVRQSAAVQVLEGVNPGERVVTKGAHLVRLATMSNQVPAHGHVH